MALTKEQILGVVDSKIRAIDVPEWGGQVFVRLMTGKQRDALEAELRKPSPANIRARVAAYAICDEKGLPVFTESDIEALAGKCYSALDRVAIAAMSLNEITEEAVESLKKKL